MVSAVRPAAQVLVVSCHPSPDSFTAAVRERVLAGLATRGDAVRHHDLYAEDWERAGDEPTHEADLAWCDTLVLVYPTWWAGQPGLLGDWILRMWPAGRRRRHIRRIVAVTSHGSPKRINVLEGEPGKRILSRWIRPSCHGRARTEWIPFYGIDTASAEARTRFLDRVEHRFARGVA